MPKCVDDLRFGNLEKRDLDPNLERQVLLQEWGGIPPPAPEEPTPPVEEDEFIQMVVRNHTV